MLIVPDKKKKALFAHVVPVKGVDEEGLAARSIVVDVVWLGFTKVVLKTDNEHPRVVAGNFKGPEDRGARSGHA